MSFRVKLRIKSVNPCYPNKLAPVSVFPPMREATDPGLLRRLYEAAIARPLEGDQWTRRWAVGPNLPDPRNVAVNVNGNGVANSYGSAH